MDYEEKMDAADVDVDVDVVVIGGEALRTCLVVHSLEGGGVLHILLSSFSFLFFPPFIYI